jgi:ribosome-associated toxin RatA of RatAB toxin-antitoxin module
VPNRPDRLMSIMNKKNQRVIVLHPSTATFGCVNRAFRRLVLVWSSMSRYNRLMLWRAMIVTGCLLLGWPGWGCATEPVVMDVRSEPTGGVRATATILFPVEPAIIHRLLTDYARWPELFDVRMRMAEIREQDGKAFTDIRIDHALLPGERRLLSETRVLPTGGLLTELRGGDFKQYRRFWKLTPVDGGTQTKAEFELLIEIDSNMPDWMVAIAMRRDLESHFRIIREKALAQQERQSGSSQ